jgi:hypothetical protein
MRLIFHRNGQADAFREADAAGSSPAGRACSSGPTRNRHRMGAGKFRGKSGLLNGNRVVTVRPTTKPNLRSRVRKAATASRVGCRFPSIAGSGHR